MFRWFLSSTHLCISYDLPVFTYNHRVLTSIIVGSGFEITLLLRFCEMIRIFIVIWYTMGCIWAAFSAIRIGAESDSNFNYPGSGSDHHIIYRLNLTNINTKTISLDNYQPQKLFRMFWTIYKLSDPFSAMFLSGFCEKFGQLIIFSSRLKMSAQTP